MLIHWCDYIPKKFNFLTSRGKHLSDLFFGLEIEIEGKTLNMNDEFYDNKHSKEYQTIKKFQKRFKKEIYLKEDGSLCNGVEIVTHPFNWNWLNKHNDFINDLISIKDYGFTVSRRCGFHVHMSKSFFTKRHLIKLRKLFYSYPKFILSISQRQPRKLYEYADPRIAIQYADKDTLGEKYPIPEEKHVALNFCNDNTLEIRIFQGTLNVNLIKAYLEFCYASVIFTRITKLEKIKPFYFKKFVNKHKKTYSNLKEILNSKIKKKLKWDTL